MCWRALNLKVHSAQQCTQHHDAPAEQCVQPAGQPASQPAMSVCLMHEPNGVSMQLTQLWPRAPAPTRKLSDLKSRCTICSFSFMKATILTMLGSSLKKRSSLSTGLRSGPRCLQGGQATRRQFNVLDAHFRGDQCTVKKGAGGQHRLQCGMQLTGPGGAACARWQSRSPAQVGAGRRLERSRAGAGRPAGVHCAG